MKRYKIIWDFGDTDYEGMEQTEDNLEAIGLPGYIDFDDNFDSVDDAADALSDEYGFCIESFELIN